MILTLKIPGIPQPKQSARFRIAKSSMGKNFIMSYQNKEVKENESNIRMSVINQLPMDFKPFTEGVAIRKLHFIFPPLKSFSKKLAERINQGELIQKTTKPDLSDNLSKGVMDSMEGIVYMNDSQICEMDNVRKFYGNEPCIIVEIEHLKEETNLLFNN